MDKKPDEIHETFNFMKVKLNNIITNKPKLFIYSPRQLVL